MDHYPEFNVKQRECASRGDSSSSVDKAQLHPLNVSKTQKCHIVASPPFSSMSPPDINNAQRSRNDSIASTAYEDDAKSQGIDAEYAQYTDAPPSYSEKQYEGKSEERQNQMRKADYAKEIQRMMGKQLVKDLKEGETKTDSET